MPPERFLRAHLAEHAVALHLIDGAHRDADVDGHVPRLPGSVDARNRVLGKMSAQEAFRRHLEQI